MRALQKTSPKRASRVAAIVVPLSNRKGWTPEEEISLRHLMHFLGKYDKYLIVPECLDITLPGFRVKPFDDRFFGSAAANSRLMFSSRFYKAFRDYRYILIYHLDALVFSDQLMEWCDTDLDYVGAPWIKCEDAAWVRIPHVGNGGFSLRKVESFLRVIHSREYWVDPDRYWEDFCRSKPRYIQYLNIPRRYLKRLSRMNGARRHMASWTGNEDIFFAEYASKYYRDFKVASFETGLQFAFELAPSKCFELNGRRLPFGCHAWHRYDRDFWEPYLLK